jgi:hypothetical protein
VRQPWPTFSSSVLREATVAHPLLISAYSSRLVSTNRQSDTAENQAYRRFRDPCVPAFSRSVSVPFLVYRVRLDTLVRRACDLGRPLVAVVTCYLYTSTATRSRILGTWSRSSRVSFPDLPISNSRVELLSTLQRRQEYRIHDGALWHSVSDACCARYFYSQRMRSPLRLLSSDIILWYGAT